jgi:hypothetical protein
MQTKLRTHNTARDMERSREKLMRWAGRAITVLLSLLLQGKRFPSKTGRWRRGLPLHE